LRTYSAYSEQELTALLKEGDQQAFNALFDQYQQLVFSIAYKLTRSRVQAKEIVQDVFLKLWMKRQQLDEIENLGAYLNRIARNQSIDELRKIAREAVRKVEIREEQMELGDRTTEHSLQFNETSHMIADALETLSPQQRRVYQLCHEQGLKYEEAAKEMGLSAGTVHAHMKLALKNIRIYLKNLDALLVVMLLMNK